MKSIKLIIILFSLTFLLFACTGKKSIDNLNEEDKIAMLDAKIKKNPRDADLYFARSKAFFEGHKHKEALIDIKNAINIDNKNADYYIFEADILFANNEISLAFTALQNAIRINGKSINAYLKSAELSLYLRDYDKVNFNINQVLMLDKLNAKAYFIKGYALKETGDTLKAVESYRKAIELKSDYGEAFEELGLLYSLKGDPIAIEYFNSALNINPKNVQVMYALGLFYQQHGNYQKALDIYKQVLDLNPNHAVTLNSVGYINMSEKKDYSNALDCFTKAIIIDSAYVLAWSNRGETYEHIGDKNKAREDYERVLKLDPENTFAKEHLHKLK
ncbi:MAG: tetratricopeptide repeat protein [Bacteroidales bacterium]|jgi:tetratricopeptide (TPR) repeat protein|nr:tetratricopeptide repeat protein [Bacteroidales bacterium]